jgi:hypothetical protein
MQVGECSGAERPFLACWHPQSRFWLSRPLVRAHRCAARNAKRTSNHEILQSEAEIRSRTRTVRMEVWEFYLCDRNSASAFLLCSSKHPAV